MGILLATRWAKDAASDMSRRRRRCLQSREAKHYRSSPSPLPLCLMPHLPPCICSSTAHFPSPQPPRSPSLHRHLRPGSHRTLAVPPRAARVVVLAVAPHTAGFCVLHLTLLHLLGVLRAEQVIDWNTSDWQGGTEALTQTAMTSGGQTLRTITSAVTVQGTTSRANHLEVPQVVSGPLGKGNAILLRDRSLIRVTTLFCPVDKALWMGQGMVVS